MRGRRLVFCRRAYHQETGPSPPRPPRMCPPACAPAPSSKTARRRPLSKSAHLLRAAGRWPTQTATPPDHAPHEDEMAAPVSAQTSARRRSGQWLARRALEQPHGNVTLAAVASHRTSRVAERDAWRCCVVVVCSRPVAAANPPRHQAPSRLSGSSNTFHCMFSRSRSFVRMLVFKPHGVCLCNT